MKALLLIYLLIMSNWAFNPFNPSITTITKWVSKWVNESSFILLWSFVERLRVLYKKLPTSTEGVYPKQSKQKGQFSNFRGDINLKVKFRGRIGCRKQFILHSETTSWKYEVKVYVFVSTPPKFLVASLLCSPWTLVQGCLDLLIRRGCSLALATSPLLRHQWK